MKVLTGRGAKMYIRIDDVFYPVLCAIDVAFEFDHEEILKTTPNSGKYIERDTRLMDWGVRLTGLTKVNNSDGQVGWFWLLQYAGQSVYMKIVYTDPDNNTVTKYGWVLIKQGQLASTISGFSTASLYFPGSGEIISDAPTGTVCPQQYTYYLQTTEGAYEVTSTDLEDAISIDLVLREDGGYELVSGTPAGRQVKWTDLGASGGKLTFDTNLPFNPGEIVTVQVSK